MADLTIQEGSCTPTGGFTLIQRSRPSWLTRAPDAAVTMASDLVKAVTWGPRMGDFQPIRCSEAIKRQPFDKPWPAWRHVRRTYPSLTPPAPAPMPVHAQVLFVGCARNLGAYALTSRFFVGQLGEQFSDHRVLLWEDSSSDGTRATLRGWAASDARMRLLTGDPPALSWRLRIHRTARLAFCRDVLLTEALKAMPPQHGQRAMTEARPAAPATLAAMAALPSQLIISLDLDCPPTLAPSALAAAVHRMATAHLKRRAAHHPRTARTARRAERTIGPSPPPPPPPSMAPPTRFHVITGNSLPMYYDRWALRSRALAIDYDCLQNRTEVARRGRCMEYDINVNPRAPVLAVDSAFGGVAIFSAAALRRAGCRYEARPDLRTCEHVGFNLCLRRRGLRLGLDPSLVVGCGKEHYHPETPTTKVVRVFENGSIRYEGDLHI